MTTLKTLRARKPKSLNHLDPAVNVLHEAIGTFVYSDEKRNPRVMTALAESVSASKRCGDAVKVFIATGGDINSAERTINRLTIAPLLERKPDVEKTTKLIEWADRMRLFAQSTTAKSYWYSVASFGSLAINDIANASVLAERALRLDSDNELAATIFHYVSVGGKPDWAVES